MLTPKSTARRGRKSAAVLLRRPVETYIDKRMVDVERVQATLEVLLVEKPNSGLVIQADERAYSGIVVKVMDAAKSAGIESIALAAEVK